MSKINDLHTKEYCFIQCCYCDLYDVKLRIDFLDYLERMNLFHHSFYFLFFQRIVFYIKHISFFIFEMDNVIVKMAYDSLKKTSCELICLNADENMIQEYQMIIYKLGETLKKMENNDCKSK